MPFPSVTDGLRALEVLAADSPLKKRPAAPQLQKTASFQGLPAEMKLQICDGLDNASLLRLGSTAKKQLRFTLDASFGLRRELLAQALQTAAFDPAPTHAAQVHLALQEHLDAVGPTRATADMLYLAESAVKKLDGLPDEPVRLWAQAFYYELLAPAMRELLGQISPAFALVHSLTQELSPAPQLSVMHLIAAQGPEAQHRVGHLAALGNLPLVAMEVRSAHLLAGQDLEQVATAVTTYLVVANRLAETWYNDPNFFGGLEELAELSTDDIQARLNGTAKQQIFGTLARDPRAYLYDLELHDEENAEIQGQSEEPGISPEKRIECTIFLTLEALPEADAKIFAFQDQPTQVRDFTVGLLRSLNAVAYSYGAFDSWLYTLSQRPGPAGGG